MRTHTHTYTHTRAHTHIQHYNKSQTLANRAVAATQAIHIHSNEWLQALSLSLSQASTEQ